MKKLIALLLAVVMVCAFAACANNPGTESTAPSTEATTPSTEATTDTTGNDVKVMTHEEFMAAEMNAVVTVETYVQAKQSWWDNKATIYTQAEDGAYFLYSLPCTEELYAQLTVGTKIRVTGIKGEYKGEVEIMSDAMEPATIEIIEGSWTATATDVTALLASEDLIKHQNEFVSFKGMTVEPIKNKDGVESAFLYNWDGSGEDGNDLYFNVSVDGKTYNFTVESYLTGKGTDVYEAVKALKVGDKIDMEGFLYWYDGVNPHITSVKPAA